MSNQPDNHPNLNATESNARLDRLESKLYQHVRRYSSVGILKASNRTASESNNESSVVHKTFRQAGVVWTPYFAAGLAEFAVRWSSPHRGKEPTISEYVHLYHHAQDFLDKDPLLFDHESKEAFDTDFLQMLLRTFGSQMHAGNRSPANFGRASFLWYDCVKKAAERKETRNTGFDFEANFDELVGVPLTDFLKVSFITSAAAAGNGSTFKRSYFHEAKKLGIDLPNDEVIRKTLLKLVATPSELRKEQIRWKQTDRRYRCYDFNPLYDSPVIRPYGYTGHMPADRDLMIAPIPHLITKRAASGIYYELARAHDIPGEPGNKFQEFFGFVFEEYVGLLLESAVGDRLLSERKLKKQGISGKIVDWAFIQGDTLIAVECKACRFPHHTFGTVSPEPYYNQGLRQVQKGLNQLAEFSAAVAKSSSPILRDVKHVIPLLITYENLFLIREESFREKVAHYKGKKLNLEGWQVLAVETLEQLQPHLAFGLSMCEALRIREEAESHFDTERALTIHTGMNYKNSILYQRDRTLHAALGQPNLVGK